MWINVWQYTLLDAKKIGRNPNNIVKPKKREKKKLKFTEDNSQWLNKE